MMIHPYLARFQMKPQILRNGPYWALQFFGIGFTNLNVTLIRRMVAALKAKGISIDA